MSNRNDSCFTRLTRHYWWSKKKEWKYSLFSLLTSAYLWKGPLTVGWPLMVYLPYFFNLITDFQNCVSNEWKKLLVNKFYCNNPITNTANSKTISLPFLSWLIRFVFHFPLTIYVMLLPTQCQCFDTQKVHWGYGTSRVHILYGRR